MPFQTELMVKGRIGGQFPEMSSAGVEVVLRLDCGKKLDGLGRLNLDGFVSEMVESVLHDRSTWFVQARKLVIVQEITIELLDVAGKVV